MKCLLKQVFWSNHHHLALPLMPFVAPTMDVSLSPLQQCPKLHAEIVQILGTLCLFTSNDGGLSILSCPVCILGFFHPNL